MLNLLERKKKLVKKNGLHQFVLWREAIRGERERVTETEVNSFDLQKIFQNLFSVEECQEVPGHGEEEKTISLPVSPE